jgi:hypothetical protein
MADTPHISIFLLNRQILTAGEIPILQSLNSSVLYART